MSVRLRLFCHCLAVLALLIVAVGQSIAAQSSALTPRESGVPLYARQDFESEPIERLEKGDMLSPMAESVGQEIWYMVRTSQGQVGWVRGVDVEVSTQVKDTFKEKITNQSSWAARTADGQTFVGTYTVVSDPSARAARGLWTLKDANGATVMNGGWSAEMHTTGWNGTWRATVDGQPGDFRGSWSAESTPSKKAGFAELFEAAVRDAVQGLWTGVGKSGGWTIRTYN